MGAEGNHRVGPGGGEGLLRVSGVPVSGTWAARSFHGDCGVFGSRVQETQDLLTK